MAITTFAFFSLVMVIRPNKNNNDDDSRVDPAKKFLAQLHVVESLYSFVPVRIDFLILEKISSGKFVDITEHTFTSAGASPCCWSAVASISVFCQRFRDE